MEEYPNHLTDKELKTFNTFSQKCKEIIQEIVPKLEGEFINYVENGNENTTMLGFWIQEDKIYLKIRREDNKVYMNIVYQD